MSLKYIQKDSITNKPTLVHIMAWYWIGDKPLSKPMMPCFGYAYMHHLASMSQMTKSWCIKMLQHIVHFAANWYSITSDGMPRPYSMCILIQLYPVYIRLSLRAKNICESKHWLDI